MRPVILMRAVVSHVGAAKTIEIETRGKPLSIEPQMLTKAMEILQIYPHFEKLQARRISASLKANRRGRVWIGFDWIFHDGVSVPIHDLDFDQAMKMHHNEICDWVGGHAVEKDTDFGTVR